MQHDEPDAPLHEAPALAPREPTNPLHRNKRSPGSKLVWPMVLGVTGLLIYGLFAPDADTKPALSEAPVVEPLRPAPRVVVAPEPVFVPTQAAVAPLPPGQPLAQSDQAQLDEAARKAREAAEAAKLRRQAPLLIAGGDMAKAKPVLTNSDAAVVLDVIASARLDTAATRPAETAVGEGGMDGRKPPAVLVSTSTALERMVLQGKTIPAVLETPIHTDFGGPVRAMVDEDVYGEAGRQVVIPRMSRLIGSYQKDARPGQSRVMVMWQRAILPDGKSLSLVSPGTDGLGRAGMAGEVDNHFVERFGAAFLVSMIGLAAENASRQNQSLGNGSVIVWGTEASSKAMDGLNATVESMLRSQANIPPTIQVAQGSRVRVFVMRDLDLSNVTQSPR